MKWTIEHDGWKWEFIDNLIYFGGSFQQINLFLEDLLPVFAEAILKESFRREFLKKTLEELKK